MTHGDDGVHGDGYEPDQTHEFECDYDSCTECFDGFGTFDEVWADAKADGWRCFKNDQGKFEHRCPEHVGQKK